MHFFDICPIDIIRDEIFPYLNYDERNAVNACLPKQDYIRTPLKKKEVLCFHMKLCASIISYHVTKVEKKHDGLGRRRAILLTYRMIIKYYLPIQHHAKFRTVINTKVDDYITFDSPGFQTIQTPKSFKKTLSGLAYKLSHILATNPFKYYIAVSDTNCDTWTVIKSHYYLEHPPRKRQVSV